MHAHFQQVLENDAVEFEAWYELRHLDKADTVTEAANVQRV